MTTPEALGHFLDRVPLNERGRYFVTDHCRECAMCTELAPAHFRFDPASGHSYVYRQPTDPDSEALCKQAMEECPTLSIFDIGGRHDWAKYPPRNGEIDTAA